MLTHCSTHLCNIYAFCGRDESSQSRLQRTIVLRPGDVGSLWWLHVNLMWLRNINFSKAQLEHVPGRVSENWVWRALMSSSNPLIDSEFDRQLRVCGECDGWGLAEEVWRGLYPAPAPSCFFSAMFTLHCEVLSHQEPRTNRTDWTEVSEKSKLEWTLPFLGPDTTWHQSCVESKCLGCKAWLGRWTFCQKPTVLSSTTVKF